MSNKEKAQEIAKRYGVPCHGMGDCEFEAYQSALEMAQWKDGQTKETVIDVWLCSIMSQDHAISNKDRQYIDLEVLKNILEDFFHIKLEEE
jgi:hypothetical protein